MYWSDIARFISAILDRWERTGREKIQEYAMLVSIYHSANPEKLYPRLIALAEPKIAGGTDDEVGDMAKLRRLKYTRGEVRTNGGSGR